jgi:uncharacterized FAD-dependent dehydrogenase
MHIQIDNLKLTPDISDGEIPAILQKRYNISVKNFKILKKSLDARDKNNICYTLRILIRVDSEKGLELIKNDHISEYIKPSPVPLKKCSSKEKIVIIGAGPAGLFCALRLIEAGLKVIILERGKAVDDRIKDIKNLEINGILNPQSNVLFGEGGAGTYSDGKLTTRTNRPEITWFYEKLIFHGADPSIEYLSKPHIGTDKLQIILKNIRTHILSSGSEIYFNQQVSDFNIRNNKITSVITTKGEEFYSSCFILATGHSARDTYELLLSKNVHLEKKGFAIGTRIEHPAEYIKKIQFGRSRYYNHLPPAEYSLSWNNKKTGRGIYSFCMCPGGYVINSASEEKMLCTNGMSMSDREGIFSNAAIVVTVKPDDTPPNPLAGIELQRSIEEKAFSAGGGLFRAPAQSIDSFLRGRKSDVNRKVSYKNGITPSRLEEFLPEWITEEIKRALPYFDNSMKGFSSNEGIFIGPETRTSSPVRITRNKSLQSVNTPGLFPSGEGAGYAGGIVSSAIDGMRCADAIIELMT